MLKNLKYFLPWERKKAEEEAKRQKDLKMKQEQIQMAKDVQIYIFPEDKAFLADLHPIFRSKLSQLLILARKKGLKIGIFSGYRSFSDQALLYNKGRDASGKVIDPKAIVTNSKAGYSWHNYGLACFDEQTEILTDRGWKLFSEISDDQVMVWKNGFLWYEKPIEYIEKKYSGKMVMVNSPTVDLCMTPDHKCVIQKRFPVMSWNPWKFTRADQLTSKDALPCIGEFLEEQPTVWYPFQDCVTPDDWWSFMGWYLSTGFSSDPSAASFRKYKGQPCVGICQKEGAGKTAVIKEALVRLPFTFKQYSNTLISNQHALWCELFPLGNNHQKYIPRYLFRAPKKLLQRLFDALIDGSGSRDTRREFYFTGSKRLAHDVAELCTLLGKASFVYVRPLSGWTGIPVPSQKMSSAEAQYCIVACSRSTNVLHEQATSCPITQEDYSGIVRCVATKAGSIVVRRNGKVCVSGNCDLVMDNSDKPGLQPSWEAAVDANKDNINDWIQLGELAESLGLTWGGRFPKLVDFPHVQYHVGITDIDMALYLYAQGGLSTVWQNVI